MPEKVLNAKASVAWQQLRTLNFSSLKLFITHAQPSRCSWTAALSRRSRCWLECGNGFRIDFWTGPRQLAIEDVFTSAEDSSHADIANDNQCPAGWSLSIRPRRASGVMEARGFEPLTSSLQSWRSTNCSYRPSLARIEPQILHRSCVPPRRRSEMVDSNDRRINRVVFWFCDVSNGYSLDR